jgi:hypothetical protein
VHGAKLGVGLLLLALVAASYLWGLESWLVSPDVGAGTNHPTRIIDAYPDLLPTAVVFSTLAVGIIFGGLGNMAWRWRAGFRIQAVATALLALLSFLTGYTAGPYFLPAALIALLAIVPAVWLRRAGRISR